MSRQSCNGEWKSSVQQSYHSSDRRKKKKKNWRAVWNASIQISCSGKLNTLKKTEDALDRYHLSTVLPANLLFLLEKFVRLIIMACFQVWRLKSNIQICRFGHCYGQWELHDFMQEITQAACRRSGWSPSPQLSTKALIHARSQIWNTPHFRGFWMKTKQNKTKYKQTKQQQQQNTP